MWKNRRKFAKLFFIIFSFSLIVLLMATASHIEHNCVGEDCTICYEINLMKNIFESLLILSLLYIFIKRIEECISLIKKFLRKKYYLTPVLLKVRLLE